MAITKDPNKDSFVFVKGNLLLKKRNRNIKFYAKEKGSNPRKTGD